MRIRVPSVLRASPWSFRKGAKDTRKREKSGTLDSGERRINLRSLFPDVSGLLKQGKGSEFHPFKNTQALFQKVAAFGHFAFGGQLVYEVGQDLG